MPGAPSSILAPTYPAASGLPKGLWVQDVPGKSHTCGLAIALSNKMLAEAGTLVQFLG